MTPEQFAQKKAEEEIEACDFSGLEKQLAEMRARFKPMSEEEYQKRTWDKIIVPELETLGIPSEHRKKIEKWGNTAQEKVFREVRGICQLKQGSIVALVGNRGTGKTTIPIQIMRERAEYWHKFYNATSAERQGWEAPLDRGMYIKLLRLSSMFKPMFADFGTTQTVLPELLENWSRVPLLVIDELHEVDDLKTTYRFLTDLLDRRYGNKVPTVIISNHSGEQFTKTLNPSCLSRISQYGKIIECKWKSWRNR